MVHCKGDLLMRGKQYLALVSPVTSQHLIWELTGLNLTYYKLLLSELEEHTKLWYQAFISYAFLSQTILDTVTQFRYEVLFLNMRNRNAIL